MSLSQALNQFAQNLGRYPGTGKSRKNEIHSAFILLRPMHAKRHNNVCDELIV